MNDEKTYDEVLQEMTELKAPREEVVDYMEQHNEQVVDLEALPKQKHRWVDRGLKLSCEGAGHAMHQAWKSQMKF